MAARPRQSAHFCSADSALSRIGTQALHRDNSLSIVALGDVVSGRFRPEARIVVQRCMLIKVTLGTFLMVYMSVMAWYKPSTVGLTAWVVGARRARSIMAALPSSSNAGGL